MLDLFRGYNHLIRPVRNISEQIRVEMALQLTLLISVDEKNQIMHTNVWLTLVWKDFQMVWKPEKYANIETIRVAPDKVWLPDIVLFNNADGNYEVSFYSNVVISHDGNMLWVPPAIYKSSCIIDVEYFPFDEQVCKLYFGSWTYNPEEVTLNFKDYKRAVDLSDFKKSSIWDLVGCPGILDNSRNQIEFQINLRRKTLFYTVVLIIPTVLMAFLSMMVFYLPTDAGEKITLAISILLSLVVFLLLVSKILPPTSTEIPLMAKYLLLTFVLNVVTILVTVIIINVYFRGPSTHKMPAWVRSVFLGVFAKLLLMQRPKRKPRRRGQHQNGSTSLLTDTHPNDGGAMLSNYFQHQYTSGSDIPTPQHLTSPDALKHIVTVPLTPEAYRAIDAIEYITEHLKQDEEYKKIREDWKYVAMIIDRLLLYVFFGVTVGGTLGILLSADSIFDVVDQTKMIATLTEKYTKQAELLRTETIIR